MATYSKGKVETLINQGRVALTNALEIGEIANAFAPLGYDRAKLEAGQALLKNLEASQATQERMYAKQTEATAALETQLAAAKKTYARHAKITRALLAEKPEYLARLGLDTSPPRRVGEWLQHAEQLYREALADATWLTLLAEGGLTEAVLHNGQAMLQATAQADAAQESAKGLAQQATLDRDAAYRTFFEWMRDFWKIAQVALRATPQWLERLGKLARS
jgi:hypothetical protein